MATVTRTTDEMVEALSASCLPCELQAAQQDVDVSAPEEWAKWEGIITYEGQMTGDGRILEKDSLRWDTLPIPLRWAAEDNGAHAGAVVVGRITEIERHDDGAIFARGDIDLESDQGKEAARQIRKGLTPGVSIDLDDVNFEVRVASEAQIDGTPDEIGEDGRVKMMAMNSDDEITITTSGRIRAATLVAIPAFEPARLALVASVITITGWSSLTAATIDEHGRWHSPVDGKYVDMPSRIMKNLFDSLNLEERPLWKAVHRPLMSADQAFKGTERRDEIGSKEFGDKLKEGQNQLYLARTEAAKKKNTRPEVYEAIENAKREMADFVDAREALLDSPDFDPDTGRLVTDDDDEIPPDLEGDAEIDVGANAKAAGEDAALNFLGMSDGPEKETALEDARRRNAENPEFGEGWTAMMTRLLEGKGPDDREGDDVAEDDDEDLEAVANGDDSPTGEKSPSGLDQTKTRARYEKMSPEERAEEREHQRSILNSDTADPEDRDRAADRLDILDSLDGDDNVDSMPEGDDVADPVGELKTSVESTLEDFDDWVGSNGGNDSAQRVYKNVRSFIQSALTEIEKGDRDSLGKANGKIAAAARVAGESGGWSGLDEGGWYDRLTDLLSSVNRTIDSVQASAFDNDPSTNWVEETGTGHLPNYIRRIADHLIANGKTESAAIASAVNTVKRWARGGSVRANGGPNVKPDTVAKAQAALAEWEAKRAQAKASATLNPITAGGFPLQPPKEWFSDPGLTGPTPLKVDKNGRVYGHLAVWGTCHTGYPNQCVTPPNSRSGYAFFRTGAVFTDTGEEIPTGVITMDTLHAGKTLSGPATLAHYEDTGRAVADIVAGEDAFGVWVAGALRPDVTEEQARSLRGSPLSGDWRRYGGALELVAALAVNVPGFPIPRTEGLAAGGGMKTLVAAGMLAPEMEQVETDDLSDQDMAYLKRMAQRERKQAEDEIAELARKVEVLDLSKRVGV